MKANSVKAESLEAASEKVRSTSTEGTAAHPTETRNSAETSHGSGFAAATDSTTAHPTEASRTAETGHGGGFAAATDSTTAHSTETSKSAETCHAGGFATATDQAPAHAGADNSWQHSAVSAAQTAWPALTSSAHSTVHSSVHSSLDWAVQVLQFPLAVGRDGAAFAADTSHQAENAATVPVIVIDHFYPDVDALRAAACEPSAEFVRDAANFYPGARRQAPAQYQQFLTRLQPLLQDVYGQTPWGGARPWQVLQAAFALTCTPPEKLRPIQMLPHFDTVSPTTLALVHYLVGPEHGGTSFYRHRSSGLCCITEQTLPSYGAALKQQAIAARLHEHPRYQAGDCALFQRIGQVSAAVNRVAIYPAHLLHSGDILQADRLSPDPREGRLTVSCLLQR